MTPDQFRSNPDLVGEMGRMLKGDGATPTVLAQAIVALQNVEPLTDAADKDPEIASVRRLSRAAARQETISDLINLAEPLAPAEPQEAAMFGVDPNDPTKFPPIPQP